MTDPMMRLPHREFVLCSVVAIACFLSALTWAPHVHSGARVERRIRLAVTIDDLPGVEDDIDAGWSKARILNTIADTLRRHHVPAPVGFFNGANMDADPATRRALHDWLNDGFVLGNHTFSHRSVSKLGASEFERDIERDQAQILELARQHAHTSRYFRYPYLERGSARDERGVRAYLRQHSYRIADVSVDFEDWAFSAAYMRCSASRAQQALTALSETYLNYALTRLFWSVDAVQRILGRAIPHVLLIHATPMTAELLDALLTEYERAGVTFVSLEEAMRDAIYARAQTARHGDTTLVVALSRERHAHLRSFTPVPASLLEALCR